MVSTVNVPEDLRYTSDHEWARPEGDRVRVGITDYAQDALGDIVYVRLPTVGEAAAAGQVLCELESTKSVSDVYAPVDGMVVDVNSELVDAPQRVNEDPYGAGWICTIEPSAAQAVHALMGAEDYRKLVEA
jgi:glycine cleavage system H protein